MTNVIPSKVNDQDHYADIKFLNLQRVWEEHDFFPGSFVDSVHLSNDGHKLVTTYLSDYLLPFVQNRCVELTAAKAAPLRAPISVHHFMTSLQGRVQVGSRGTIAALQIRCETSGGPHCTVR